MAKETKDITTGLAYRALTIDQARFHEIVNANTGNAGLAPHELDRVKVPAGGGGSWAVPSLSGDQETKELEGVVIFWKEARGYWPRSFSDSGGGEPPQCSSDDGLQGVGDPGGVCLTCPLAQFGSAPARTPNEKAKGQACKASRLLFMLRPNDLLPIVVSLPPTSLKPCRDYFRRLANEEHAFYNVVTGMTLTKDKNDAGIPYSVATFRMIRSLSPEDLVKVSEIVQTFKPLFETTRQSPDVYAE